MIKVHCINMVGVTIVSPLNKRLVRGSFHLRLKYTGEVQDKQVGVYANGELVDVFTPSSTIPLSDLNTDADGKVKLTVALIEDGHILSKESINLIYKASENKKFVPKSDTSVSPVAENQWIHNSHSKHHSKHCSTEESDRSCSLDDDDCSSVEKSKSRPSDDYSERIEQRSGWGDSSRDEKPCKITVLGGCGKKSIAPLGDCGCGKKPKSSLLSTAEVPQLLGSSGAHNTQKVCFDVNLPTVSNCHPIVASQSLTVPREATHLILEDVTSSRVVVTLPELGVDGAVGDDSHETARHCLQIFNFSCKDVKIRNDSGSAVIHSDGSKSKYLTLAAGKSYQLIFVGRWYVYQV